MDTEVAPLFALHPSGFPAVVVAGRAISLSIFVPADKQNGQAIEPLHRARAKVITPAGQRPRPQIYSDPRSTKWEEYVASVVMETLRQTPTTGDGEDFTLPIRDMRVLSTLRFNMPKPPSYPARVTMNTKKPDVDNLAKGVLDALVKARVLADDNMVTDQMIMKRYVEPGHPEGVEIDLTAVPCEVV